MSVGRIINPPPIPKRPEKKPVNKNIISIIQKETDSICNPEKKL